MHLDINLEFMNAGFCDFIMQEVHVHWISSFVQVTRIDIFDYDIYFIIILYCIQGYLCSVLFLPLSILGETWNWVNSQWTINYLQY